jgi:hypothetical protein
MELQQGFGIHGMGQRDPFAARQLLAAHVRFGSKASFPTPSRHVRFTPNSDGHGDTPEGSLSAIRWGNRPAACG